ncbi:hypothetical protein GCM10022246_40480 [Pedobacter ginsengiterrae]|uniref:RiboL-PSP-HEPN domain-containing protein n=1 Tax=Pedobacter ginsengiterrae TaxID=871696 RepID=A0ABP7QLP2_9SPHI
MGYWKQLSIDSYEDEEGNAIAEALGISYYDLRRTTYQIEENTSEDGYIYNYRIVFTSDIPKDVLGKIQGLSGNSVDIDKEILMGDYAENYDYEFEAISSNIKLSDNFDHEIDNLEKLNEVDLGDEELNTILKRQIYIGVIGSMETFLSETFIKLTLNNPDTLQKFVKTHPEFANRRFDLKDVFEAHKNIQQTAKSIMLDTIYHNLPTVRLMYMSTFEIKFPSIKEAVKCIMVRHDLVHRNGKTKEEVTHVLSTETIGNTIGTVRELIKELVSEIENKNDLDIDFTGL